MTYAETVARAEQPALSPSTVLPWVAGRSARVRRSSNRMRILASEAVWALIEPRIEPLRYAGFMQRAVALRTTARRLCRSHGVVTHIRGSFPDQPTVIVANHLSYLDPLVLVGLHPVSPVAKAEVSGWPFIGQTLNDFGVNFVERGNPYSGANVIRRGLRALRAGVSVLNFPEGTTSTGESLLPFHRGIFGLARLAGVPVTPVSFAFDEPDLCWVGGEGFLPHYLRTTARPNAVVRVNVGEPIDAQAADTVEGLSDLARHAILDLMAS
jgi:1-acyl-sn-glycerol-3-phosphate acyltransferase